MIKKPAKVLEAVGAPARVAEQRLEGRRRPIWWVCWTIVWGLVVWDVFLAVDATDGNTWSEVLREASFTNPALPWIFGSLTTHLFHHKDDLRPVLPEDSAHTVMAVITLSLAVSALTDLTLGPPHVVAFTIAGMITAYALWPNHRRGEWHW